MKNTKLQNPSLRKRKGFTLIELIVVIAILAILAAIAIPVFLGQLDRARTSTDNANVKTLRSAAAVALAENGVGAFTWTSASLTDSVSDGGAYDADKYLTDWPTDPWNATPARNYQVGVSATGIITVNALGAP